MSGKIEKARSKWLVLEEEDYIHVMPERDIKPHGKEITKVLFELSAVCTCAPKIEVGEKNEVTGIFFTYSKPIVIHNSFSDEEFIKRSIDMIVYNER